jgi:hypothetical protein
MRAHTLALHIDFENALVAPGSWLNAFVADAVALGAAAKRLRGSRVRVVAVLFVPRQWESAAQTEVCWSGPASKTAASVCAQPRTSGVPLQSLPASALAEFAAISMPKAPENGSGAASDTNTSEGRSCMTAIDAMGCFAFAHPHENVTVLRYLVPSDIRNGSGNPLPKSGVALRPADAARLYAALRALFPQHFTQLEPARM